MPPDVAVDPIAAAREVEARYAQEHDRPLGSFVVLMAAYLGAVGGLGWLLRRSGRSLPARPGWSDLVMSAVATHKLARLITKDTVTSPFRAPFTRFVGAAGEGELAEEVRGTGLRKALGELLTCPFCIGHWVATAFAFGLLFAPGPTRFAQGILCSLTGADVLQLVYARLKG